MKSEASEPRIDYRHILTGEAAFGRIGGVS